MSAALPLVVFDVDGTLVDSQHTIAASMATAFDLNGYPRPDLRDVRRVVGLSLVEAVARLLPTEPDSRHATVAEDYKAAFFELRNRPDHDDPLFPGARDVVSRLDAAGYQLGICTGKSRRGLVAVLTHHGLSPHFVTAQTADQHPGKPHPAMLRQAMAEAGAEPATTVLVGDTSFDMAMARNAGVAPVGVSWGYHEVAELKESGADVVIDHFDDLLAEIEALIGSPAGTS